MVRQNIVAATRWRTANSGSLCYAMRLFAVKRFMAEAITPDARELRNFGLVVGAMLATLFGLWPFLSDGVAPLWPWPVALSFWLVALLLPNTLIYIYRLWLPLGHALGWLNTRVILSVIYVIAIVPAGFVMQLLGRDPMERKFDPTISSYRVPSRPRPPKHMERPF